MPKSFNTPMVIDNDSIFIFRVEAISFVEENLFYYIAWIALYTLFWVAKFKFSLLILLISIINVFNL